MESFREKLEAHMVELFPGYAVKAVKSVGMNPDTGRFRTETREAVISNGSTTMKVFVKSFSDWFVRNRKDDIDFTIEMGRKERTNLPKIYGFFSDINSYIMEDAGGNPMSKAFASYSSLFHPSGAGKREFLVREVARSVAFLQNETRKGREPFSYRSFVLDKNPALERLIGGSKKLSGVVEGMEGRKIMMSRGYNDLKLGNIMVSSSIKFIDPGAFVYKWFFINPVTFSVGLQLAQKFPLFRGFGFQFLRRAFYDEYLARLKWKADRGFLDDMEMLKKCELLCYFTSALKSGVSIKHSIPMRLSIKRLRRDIRDFQRN